MSKKLACILGNGFTIDFLQHIKTNNIDVSNLFRLGSNVPWPSTSIPGFLSFKHCPNLWNLGARPNMSTEDAMSLIEDIITCVNVYASHKKPPAIGAEKPNEIFIRGYKELSEYLKHLFIFYNHQLVDIPNDYSEWSWFKFIRYAVESSEYNEINIVSYNYDVWLERMLLEAKIPFNISGFETDPSAKITIFKPHGSISFTHRKVTSKDTYAIKYAEVLPDSSIKEFEVRYDNLDNNYLVSALIPPAGESSRLDHSWAKEIKKNASESICKLSDNDEMIICGISYWHVDRAEIDDLLIGCSSNIDLTLVNPNPKRTLDAVLTSLFKNLVVYTSSKILEDRINE